MTIIVGIKDLTSVWNVNLLRINLFFSYVSIAFDFLSYFESFSNAPYLFISVRGSV